MTSWILLISSSIIIQIQSISNLYILLRSENNSNPPSMWKLQCLNIHQPTLFSITIIHSTNKSTHIPKFIRHNVQIIRWTATDEQCEYTVIVYLFEGLAMWGYFSGVLADYCTFLDAWGCLYIKSFYSILFNLVGAYCAFVYFPFKKLIGSSIDVVEWLYFEDIFFWIVLLEKLLAFIELLITKN